MPLLEPSIVLSQSFNVPGYGTVQYDELVPGSPIYTFTHGGSRAERTFVVRWADRDKFVKGVVGYPTIKNTGQSAPWGAVVSRVLPDALPDMLDPTDSQPFLYATGVSRLEGVAPTGATSGPATGYDADGVAEYLWARVTVVYESLTYVIAPDNECLNPAKEVVDEGPGNGLPRYVTKQRKPSAEFLALPRGLMRWADSNLTKVDFATASLVPSVEITYTWHQVPFLPDALQTHVGTLNLTPFFDGDYTYNPGTLLLLSADLKPYRHASGQFVHDIAYRMKYFEPQMGRGHNYFLRYDSTTNALVRRKMTHTGNNDALPVPAVASGTWPDPNANYTTGLTPQPAPAGTRPWSWNAGAAPSSPASGVTPITDGTGAPVEGISLYDYTEFAWLFSFHNPGAYEPARPIAFYPLDPSSDVSPPGRPTD